MADDALQRAAQQELMRRKLQEAAQQELERRQQQAGSKKVAGQISGRLGSKLKSPGSQQSSAAPGDDLAYRGALLPLGRTTEGKIVPAMPQAFYDAAKMTQGATQGGGVDPGEAFKAAAAFAPVSPGLRAVNSALPKPIKPEIPTTAGLGAEKRAAYSASEAAGVGIRPEATKDLLASLNKDLEAADFDPALHPRSGAVMGVIAKRAAEQTGDIPLSRLDNLRKITRAKVREAYKAGDESDARIGEIIIDKIDDFIGGLNEKQITPGGNVKEGTSQILKARELALRESKAEQIDDLIYRAGIKKGKYSASGYENSLRNQFESLAADKKKMSKFSKEEQEAIREAGTSSTFQQGLIKLGKFAPSAGMLGAAISGVFGGGALTRLLSGGSAIEALGEIGLPIAAEISRYAATKMREQSVKNVSELVRGGRPMSDYRMQQALRTRNRTAPIITRGGLMGGAGLMPEGDDFNPLTHPNQT